MRRGKKDSFLRKNKSKERDNLFSFFLDLGQMLETHWKNIISSIQFQIAIGQFLSS